METGGGKKELIYVKRHPDPRVALPMFRGELESLKAIERTGRVRVPHPVAALEGPSSRAGAGGGMLVMEHLELEHLGDRDRELGECVARW